MIRIFTKDVSSALKTLSGVRKNFMTFIRAVIEPFSLKKNLQNVKNYATEASFEVTRVSI